ncbi:MAG: hypothetical protein JXA42_08050 [Anaerolineales bacterium]|nr:hypothetical protein [Anaerolineales bacterium]
MQPIYRSDGEAVAVVHRGHLYNIDGEWIGVLIGAEIYGHNGEYIGFLSEDRRLLRTRRPPKKQQIRQPPLPPHLKGIPERFPLAPLFKQLPYGLIDIFEEFPNRYKYIAEVRSDMD